MTATGRDWTSRVGSQQSVSVRAWLLTTPVGVVAAPLAVMPEQSNGAEVLHWLALGLMAQVPLGLVLLAGGLLTRRAPWPRIAVVVVTVLAGAARGLTLAMMGGAPDVALRIAASAVTMSIWLLVIGAALDSHARHRIEVEALLDTLVARELHGRLLDPTAMDAARSASAARIAETSGDLRAIVQGASEDHLLTAALLQSAIETRLRPLSHDLWFSPRPVPPVAHHRRDAVRRVLTAAVPVVPLSLAALVLLTWGSLVLHGAWTGAIVGLVVALAYAGVLSVAHRLRRWARANVVCRYLGASVIPAIVGAVAISLLGLSHLTSTVAVALGLPLITMGVAAAVTLGTDRAAIIADLKDRIAEPEWDRHLGELVRREVEADSATVLHNAIQPALTAAALQLQLAAALDDPARARAALARASWALEVAEAGRALTFLGRDRLEHVAEAWSGIARVELTLPMSSLLSREWGLVADTVDESIANAVRHGHATWIAIRIDVDGQDIAIEMTDDGVAETTMHAPGLGRTWLESVVSSARVRREGNVRRTLLHLPRPPMPARN